VIYIFIRVNTSIINIVNGVSLFKLAHMKNILRIVFLIPLMTLSVYCKKNPAFPVLSTAPVSKITATTAKSGGNVTSDGGSQITARGICWSVSDNPVVSDNKAAESSGPGSFTCDLSHLSPGTKYYIRAYATNSTGTSYGSSVSFTTLASNYVTDIDSNSYRVIAIGTQIWMAENLRSTKYNDGTPILLVTDTSQWRSANRTGAYCWVNNNPVNKYKYGAIYNWTVVDQYYNSLKNVCPSGWHVPEKAEWLILRNYLIQNGYGYGGDSLEIAKSIASISGWETSYGAGMVGNDQVSNNSSEFNGLPTGTRLYDGTFQTFGRWGSWWAQPDDYTLSYSPWCIVITYDNNIISFLGLGETYGSSIRCLKNQDDKP